MTVPAVPSVAICFAHYKQWEAHTGLCAVNLAAATAKYCGMLCVGCSGAYVEDNRNGAVKAALKYEEEHRRHDPLFRFDYLMWIDTDMVFPPDLLLRLIAHDKDIVGCNYRQRVAPHGFTGHYKGGGDTKLLEPGLHEMDHLPTGLLLTRMDIYRKLPYPWFKPGLIESEARDDVYFCNTAREAGYEIWCDHDLTKEVGHIGEQVVQWFTVEQLKPVVKGAELNLETSRLMGEENISKTAHGYQLAREAAA